MPFWELVCRRHHTPSCLHIPVALHRGLFAGPECERYGNGVDLADSNSVSHSIAHKFAHVNSHCDCDGDGASAAAGKRKRRSDGKSHSQRVEVLSGNLIGNVISDALSSSVSERYDLKLNSCVTFRRQHEWHAVGDCCDVAGIVGLAIRIDHTDSELSCGFRL